jgi:hypothetical protein
MVQCHACIPSGDFCIKLRNKISRIFSFFNVENKYIDCSYYFGETFDHIQDI